MGAAVNIRANRPEPNSLPGAHFSKLVPGRKPVPREVKTGLVRENWYVDGKPVLLRKNWFVLKQIKLVPGKFRIGCRY